MCVDLTGPAQNSPSKLRSSPALNVSSVRCVRKGPSEGGRHRTRRGEAVGQARKAMGSHFNRTDGSTCPLFCRQGRSPASLQLPCRFEKEKKARPTIPAQVSKYLTCLAYLAALLHVRTHTHSDTTCTVRTQFICAYRQWTSISSTATWTAAKVRPMRP